MLKTFSKESSSGTKNLTQHCRDPIFKKGFNIFFGHEEPNVGNGDFHVIRKVRGPKTTYSRYIVVIRLWYRIRR